MAFERFTSTNATLLLIDHQVGTMSWVHSIPLDDMKRNAVMLAKTAKILDMPVVLTVSMEEHAQGPLMPELATVLPTEFDVATLNRTDSLKYLKRGVSEYDPRKTQNLCP